MDVDFVFHDVVMHVVAYPYLAHWRSRVGVVGILRCFRVAYVSCSSVQSSRTVTNSMLLTCKCFLFDEVFFF